jgi:AsmA family protein
MMRIVRMLLVVLLVIAGGLFALTFVDINRYKPEIQSLAQELTGRTLHLDGPLKIGFSLQPMIVVEDVRFGNAPWASEENMFAAEEVAVRLSLLPLLVGSLDVQRLDVRGASLLLERDPGNGANWELNSTSKEDGSAQETTTQDLPRVVIDDLQLTYVSGRRDAATEVHFERADVEPRTDGVSIGLTGSVGEQLASVSGFVKGDAEAFSISDLDVAYDGLIFSGHLEGTRRSPNAPFQIDGKLEADEANLDVLLDTETTTPSAGLFSDNPLPFEMLDVVEGEIEITISKLIYHSLEMNDVQAAFALSGGKLSAPIFAEYQGRRLEANVEANNSSQPSVAMTVNAPGFDIGQFLKHVDATDLVDVRGHIGIDVSGRGRSVKAIMSSLEGKVDVATGRGEIHSSAFELIAEDLLWALIPKGGEKGVANLTCFINELRFTRGVGEVTALALVTDKIRTSGGGSINLGSETIDMTLNPRPNDPGLLSLATPVNITGSLADPSISPDTTAILGDVALSVGAGLLTGGIGAILPLISAESFDAESTSACLRVIAGGSSASPKEDKGLLDHEGEGVGDVIRGVGDVLTSPFD